MSAYISKINSDCKKQIILKKNSNEKKKSWYYLEVKNIIEENNIKNGDFYCLNCLHPFRTENKLKSHEKIYKNKDFFGNVIPSQKGCKLINI